MLRMLLINRKMRQLPGWSSREFQMGVKVEEGSNGARLVCKHIDHPQVTYTNIASY